MYDPTVATSTEIFERLKDIVSLPANCTRIVLTLEVGQLALLETTCCIPFEKRNSQVSPTEAKIWKLVPVVDRQMEPESSQKLPVGVPFSERSEAKPARNRDTCRHEDPLEEKAPYRDCRPSATNPGSTWQAKTSEECPKMTHLNCGRLRISQRLLADYPDVVATLFGLLRFVPTHIESELYQPGVRYLGVAEYLGDSPFFASLVAGVRVPLYEATVTDGRVAVRKVEEK